MDLVEGSVAAVSLWITVSNSVFVVLLIEPDPRGFLFLFSKSGSKSSMRFT
eukprot:m.104029 g.104029  ORF g.104029 m.104029 type:complete len:51 (+) comp37198_c0_seq20:3862-4014(+)